MSCRGDGCTLYLNRNLLTRWSPVDHPDPPPHPSLSSSSPSQPKFGVQTRARGAHARYLDLDLDLNSAEISPKKSDTSTKKSKATESEHDSQTLYLKSDPTSSNKAGFLIHLFSASSAVPLHQVTPHGYTPVVHGQINPKEKIHVLPV